MFALLRVDLGVLAVKSRQPRERVLFASQIWLAQTLSRTCILWLAKACLNFGTLMPWGSGRQIKGPSQGQAWSQESSQDES